jgi:hypothetical protein
MKLLGAILRGGLNIVVLLFILPLPTVGEGRGDHAIGVTTSNPPSFDRLRTPSFVEGPSRGRKNKEGGLL